MSAVQPPGGTGLNVLYWDVNKSSQNGFFLCKNRFYFKIFRLLQKSGINLEEIKIFIRFSMIFRASGLWTRPIRAPYRTSIKYELNYEKIAWLLGNIETKNNLIYRPPWILFCKYAQFSSTQFCWNYFWTFLRFCPYCREARKVSNAQRKKVLTPILNLIFWPLSISNLCQSSAHA